MQAHSSGPILPPIRVRQVTHAMDDVADAAAAAADNAKHALQDAHDAAASKMLRFVEPLGGVRAHLVSLECAAIPSAAASHTCAKDTRSTRQRVSGPRTTYCRIAHPQACCS